jgi:hypothetical protein
MLKSGPHFVNVIVISIYIFVQVSAHFLLPIAYWLPDMENISECSSRFLKLICRNNVTFGNM